MMAARDKEKIVTQISISSVNALDYLSGPMRAVQLDGEGVVLGCGGYGRIHVPFEGLSNADRISLVRNEWEPRWFPIPEAEFPHKGMLILKRIGE